MQGRDANRLLQRVIKAEEKKKKLPKLIAKLRQQLAEWQAPPLGSSKPFVLGHLAYGPEVLDVIEEELKTMSDVKLKKARLQLSFVGLKHPVHLCAVSCVFVYVALAHAGIAPVC